MANEKNVVFDVGIVGEQGCKIVLCRLFLSFVNCIVFMVLMQENCIRSWWKNTVVAVNVREVLRKLTKHCDDFIAFECR